MCVSVNCAGNDFHLKKEDTTNTIEKKMKLPIVVNTDVLGKVTSVQKKALDVFYSVLNRAHSNNKLRVIIDSSTPVHAMALIAVVFVGSVFFPSQSQSPKPYSSFTSLIYLMAFCLHYGAQFWMTFVSGLTLYFSLPRHIFGDVQRILFPRYFTINSILSAILLLSFSKLYNHLSWEPKHWTQVIALSCCFLLESLARLYIAPQVVNLIEQKKEMEIAVDGVGKEIGTFCPGRLVACPRYMSIHTQFRKQHSMMAIANVLSMICATIHLICLHRVFLNSL